MKGMKVNGLLISAGLSGRMGEFKPLMLFDGESFITGITRKLLRFCNEVVVVSGFQNEKVESVINSQFQDRVSCAYNPHFEKGMFTSLKAGIDRLENSDWVLYHFVDQPFFTNEFYYELILHANNECDWVQPVCDGKEGHPVMFNRKVIELVKESSLDSNLRMIRDLPRVRKNYWNCHYPEVLVDFDTREDLERFNLNQ